jgi:hypothetical protein
MASLKTIRQEKTMNSNSVGPAMSQKIFSMDLDVETVSLYLLCWAIADAGAAVTQTSLLEKWNGNLTALEQALRQLEGKNILGRDGEDARGEPVYRIMEEKQWR